MGGEQPPTPRSLSPTLGVPPPVACGPQAEPPAPMGNLSVLLSAMATCEASIPLQRSASVPATPDTHTPRGALSLKRSAPLDIPQSAAFVSTWTNTFTGARSPSPIVFEPCVYDPSFLQRNNKQEKLGASNFRCSHCKTTSTPEVRCGPDGKRSLCNNSCAPSYHWIEGAFIAANSNPRCGIRYSKQKKHAVEVKKRMSVAAILTDDAAPKRLKEEPKQGQEATR